MNKKVSVIIPIYNTGQYLPDCFNSILKQDISKDVEIIAVDDGSDKDTKNMLEFCADQAPIKVITLPKNSGVSVARNAGMDAATGEWFCFVDSDDTIGFDARINRDGFGNTGLVRDETVSEKFFSNMLKHQNTGADIITCDRITVMNREFRTNRYFTDFLPGKSAANSIAMDKNEYMAGFLYRAEFLVRENIRFFPDMKLNQDIAFSQVAAYHAKKIVSAHDSVYMYWPRAGSESDSSCAYSHVVKSKISMIQMASIMVLVCAKNNDVNGMLQFAKHFEKAMQGHNWYAEDNVFCDDGQDRKNMFIDMSSVYPRKKGDFD
ncbi:MAG: glycosyltransferase family 2 protein [Alphaproteobacteria bacterium]|nr:glycosyltransferase family 2 protein [Alphaproteobacteria bacterium]